MSSAPLNRDPLTDTSEWPTADPWRDDARLARRREDAARDRRRRLLGLDIALGLLIGAIALVLSPGLAMGALVSAIVLVGCGLWALLDRRRAARMRVFRGRARRRLERSGRARRPG